MRGNIINFFGDITLFSDSVAIFTEKYEQITYRTLCEQADTLKKQIKGRCLVFSLCQNSLESIIGYLAFLRARAVPILLNDSIHPDLFKDLLKKYKPEYIWLPKNKINLHKSFRLVYSLGNYVLIKTTNPFYHEIHDDLALLLTTSGSTGSPKLVRISYNNITSNADSIAEYLNINQTDRPITSLPMTYSYGLSIINSHLLKGCSIILTNQTIMNKDFWELLKKNKATTFGGVPYTYEMLKKLRFFRMELPSLKVLTQAGGKLRPELVEEFAVNCEQKGIRFIVMYGQAEASPRMAYLPSEYAGGKAESIGVPIPGGEFWLEDEGQEIIMKSDTIGELVYKGKNVCMGYALGCPDLYKGDENEGILRTGDMAKRDDEGFYYIVGRKKRFLKLFGNRINLDEVEQILRNAGFDCACAGEDDNLKIFVTEKEHLEKIKKYIIDRTGINPAGYEIKYIQTIPRNETGKTLYSLLH